MSPAKRTKGGGDSEDALLARVREICLALPDTRETPTWGKPHFRIGEKIFAGCGVENGSLQIGFKLEPGHAAAVVRDPRFRRAPYVGHKGWVQLDARRVKDWDEVRELVLESYRLIAPKRTLARLAQAAKANPAGGSQKKGARRPRASGKRKTVPTTRHGS